MTSRTHTRHGLFLFRPPYEMLDPLSIAWGQSSPAAAPGQGLVWLMGPTREVYGEMEWVRERPRHLPLLLVLPDPEDILPLSSMLRLIPDLNPRDVLPGAGAATPATLRHLLAAPPRSLPMAVADYLTTSGIVQSADARTAIELIFGVAPQVSSISGLAERMCQSRRTLGRFFRDRDLPVPSHWLQFARILHVAIQLQNTRLNIGRVAARFGYSDGFTMSNTMKRLTGYRPSFIRRHLGWEWILEAWLRREGM